MRLLELADQHRKEANKLLNPKTKSALGQFMTPAPICLFMASLFDDIKGDIKLLDPGCGVGSLSAAFVERALRLDVDKMELDAIDIAEVMLPYLSKTLKACDEAANGKLTHKISKVDYILEASLAKNISTSEEPRTYSHVIMNPLIKNSLVERSPGLFTQCRHRNGQPILWVCGVSFETAEKGRRVSGDYSTLFL